MLPIDRQSPSTAYVSSGFTANLLYFSITCFPSEMVAYSISLHDSAVALGNAKMYNSIVPFVITDGRENSMASIVFRYGRLFTALRIVSTSSWSRRFELTDPVLATWHTLMISPIWLASMMALCRVDAVACKSPSIVTRVAILLSVISATSS